MWTKEYDVAAVLTRLNIDYLPENDQQASACCPVHAERKPSFRINLDSGLWICFSCGAKGNLPQLASRIWGTSSARAAARLRSCVTGAVRVRPTRAAPVPELHPDAVAVWLDFGMPTARMLARRNITTSGLFGWNWSYDLRVDGRDWIIPVKSVDDENVLRGWQRKTPDGRVFNEPTGMSKTDSLFGFHQARRFLHKRDAPAILVESPLDVARMASAGIWGAVASYGTSLSDHQFRAIVDRLKWPCILAYDNDSAGHAATDRLMNAHPGYFTKLDYTTSTAKDPGEMTDDELKTLFPLNTLEKK